MMQTYFFALRFRIPPDGMNPRRFPERFSVLRLAGFGALHFLVGVVCTDFPANFPVNFPDSYTISFFVPIIVTQAADF
jgi:hypothetical protein